MTPTSPPTTTTIPPTRPPARNKSSSALSTQTIRSLSATSTGKPRRNKSSASLAAHHHPAGHHAVSFAHHRKNSHGSHSMKRKDSKGSAFGLGMTSMTRADDEEGEHHADEERDGERRKRPELGSRRSSSSSTVTVVGGRGRRQSSDTALERSRSRHREPSPPPQVAQSPEQERPLTVDTKLKGKEKISGSVTSTSDWESATDSPLAIGKKLPDVSRSFKTEGHSALSLAMDGKAEEQPQQQKAQQRAPTPTRANGKKPKFELVGSEDQDDEELASPPGIPSAAMPPAETPVLPAMPAVVEALVPASSPTQDEKVPPPEYSQEVAAAMPPAPTSAPQGISPPEAQAGAPPPAPELTKLPPALDDTRPAPEPTLAAANTDEPNMASALDKEYQQAHQGLTSAPRPSPTRPPSRVPPTRKSSNASILSANSNRSMAPSLISRMGPQPHFRRSASGIAPVVDRAAMARAEMASPSPDSAERERNEAARKSVVGERQESAHRRTESLSSMQSLRAAADATAPARRANTFGPADAKRLRPSETAGTALAALGNIAAASRPPSTDGTSTPSGALTHAKRSASGYFSSALRGLTGIPSALTPPLSPSASASTRYPIPGATNPPPSSSYGRSGRSRSSPSPQQPPLIVKFLEPAPPAPHPPPTPASQVERSSSAPPPLSSSPATRHLSQQHRNSSSASLGPMSRTQQKALLARDAPYWGHHASSGSSGGGGGAAAPPVSASSSLAPPPAPSPAPSQQGQLTPAQQQYLVLQQQRQHAAAASASASASTSSSTPSSTPSPQAVAAQQQNGMQKWAFGLVREAERIERQYRAVEKWRDPLGESLERVLARRAADRAAAAAASMSASAGSSASASAVGSGASTPLRGASSQVGKVRGE
ncbi:hypothetical protein JCM1840_002803 [Sporobolomyces johnsonii]